MTLKRILCYNGKAIVCVSDFVGGVTVQTEMCRQKQMLQIFNVAPYIRLSREDGDKAESESVANQRDLIEMYIKNQDDMRLHKFYIDDGYTGTNFERPAFQQMIRDIENGIIDCVIVKDLSRIGRNYIDTGQYLERFFPQHRVRFIAINDNIDNFNQRYDISVPIRNIVNAQYAEDISKKVISSIRTKQREGKFIGSFASYGYKKDANDKNKLVIDEPAAEVVRRIFSMFRSGYGFQTIARILTDEGIPCPSEYKRLNGENYSNAKKLVSTSYWTYSTVRNILKKQIYAGDMVQHKANMSRYNYGERNLPESDWLIVENTHPAIIERKVWEETQLLIGRRYKSVAVNSAHIFSGIIKCRECGRGLVKITRRGQAYLSCGTYKRAGKGHCSAHNILFDDLYQIVLKAINEHIQRLCDLEKIVLNADMLDKKSKTMKVKLREAQNSLDKVQNNKRRLYEDYRDGILNREEYMQYKNEYESQITLLEKKITALSEEQSSPLKDDVMASWFQKMKSYGELEQLTQEVIQIFIERIFISERKDKPLRIEIQFAFQDKMDNISECLEQRQKSS